MTQPNRSSALRPLLCLALGLAGGFGSARFLSAERSSSEIEASANRQAALTPQESATIVEPEAALSPQDETRVEERVAIAPAEAPSGGAQSPPPKREIDPDLENELTAYLRSGKFEERMRRDGQLIQEFLASEYVRLGEPQRAMEVLEKYPSLDADLYMAIAPHLLRSGGEGMASRAYLKAFELSPYDEDILEELIEVDPSGALASVEARARELGSEAHAALDLQRARLLSALGRTEEAVVVAQNLVGFNNRDPWALELLAELDPAGAELELRSRLADDSEGTVAVSLAENLMESERNDEAVILLEAALARSPGNSNALSLLGDLQPEKVLLYLDSPAASELESYALSSAASLLLKSGKEIEAVDLWVRAVDRDVSDGEAIEGLLEYAPERLWEKYRGIAQESSDDERLGDVADMYWRQGHKEEAAALWRRASMIDPGDSEWSNNLRSILLGEDPL